MGSTHPDDLIAVGADLEPGTVLAAYRAGLFPMEVDAGRRRKQLGWWSPDPRTIIPLDGLRISKSLRRSRSRFVIRIDHSFEAVMRACADPGRSGGWISEPFIEAYTELHRLGWAHSIEAWTPEGELAGGLYGLALGGVFAGESMFHRYTDASKEALVELVERLRKWGYQLLDVQWSTPHLESLGAVSLSRDEYLRSLERALAQPAQWGGS
jgi:leucyl/phenylalanyl-tRNA--protein transferase